MTFVSLASSSAGNAYLVKSGDETLLLECGLTLPKLKKALGFTLCDITACFVTHEHGDHSHSAGALLRAGIPVYMSAGTAEALELREADIVEYDRPAQLGAFRVLPFRVWHDAREPVGYLIEEHGTGERLLFCADTRNLAWTVSGLCCVAVECNYDDRMLAQSQRINDKLRERIRHTHFEVNDVLKYLHKLDLSKCLRIYLLHLSGSHSNEHEFYERFRKEFPGIEITICPA